MPPLRFPSSILTAAACRSTKIGIRFARLLDATVSGILSLTTLSSHPGRPRRGDPQQRVSLSPFPLPPSPVSCLPAGASPGPGRLTITICVLSCARRVNDLQTKIKSITDGEYTVAKQDVDRLRQELGQLPLPSLQSTLEEKSAECVPPSSCLCCSIMPYPCVSRRSLTCTSGCRRLPFTSRTPLHTTQPVVCRYLKALRLQAEAASAATGTKRPGEELGADGQPVKRPRGRPKGSKNSKTKAKPAAASPTS